MAPESHATAAVGIAAAAASHPPLRRLALPLPLLLCESLCDYNARLTGRELQLVLHSTAGKAGVTTMAQKAASECMLLTCHWNGPAWI